MKVALINHWLTSPLDFRIVSSQTQCQKNLEDNKVQKVRRKQLSITIYIYATAKMKAYIIAHTNVKIHFKMNIISNESEIQ